MSQIDWIGREESPRLFSDIGNQRPSTAEQKAEALLRLGRLINRIPPVVANGGSVDQVRAWKRVRGECAKVAGNQRSTLP